MRPRERRESGEQDLFRARLDQIIDMDHELAKVARAIGWRFLEEKFGAVYTDRPGRPPLPSRLMAGLAILKHTFDLSDEVVCARWVENPYSCRWMNVASDTPRCYRIVSKMTSTNGRRTSLTPCATRI
jgi:hypothetical protein